MRTRPSKSARDALRDNGRLSELVLRGDYTAARVEAERVQKLQREREQRAAEWQRREAQRYGR